MPLFAAAVLPFTLTAAAAGATAGAGIYSANKQAGAAQDAAKLQTDAANKSADLQAKANADALAFQKEQAAQDLARTNSTNQANYGQWAAKEGRLSDFGQMLGLSPRNIPAFQPIPSTLASSQTAPAAGPMPSGQAPSGNLADPKAWMALVGNDQALTDFVTQGLGTAAQKPGLVDYYKKVIKGQPGANEMEQAGSAKYYQELFAKDPNVTGKSAAPMVNSPAALMAQPNYGQSGSYVPTNLTPALQAPSMNSFAAFLSR